MKIILQPKVGNTRLYYNIFPTKLVEPAPWEIKGQMIKEIISLSGLEGRVRVEVGWSQCPGAVRSIAVKYVLANLPSWIRY